MIFLASAYQISIMGNRGLFYVKNAQCHNMGMFSVHIHPEYYYVDADKDTVVGGSTITLNDNRHYPRGHLGISYAIIDYLELRGRADLFGKWYEANNEPFERGDPSAPVWFEQTEIGLKAGVPIIINEKTPTIISFGAEGFVNFAAHLPREFGNPYDKDKKIYSYYQAKDGTRFHPYRPHEPDFAGMGLMSYRIGPFGAHINLGHQATGKDELPKPNYLIPGDEINRPQYFLFGGGIEIIPTPYVNLIFETHGKSREDNWEDSILITPGVRFNSGLTSIDLGCHFDLNNQGVWNAFIGISASADLIQPPHIPKAKIAGRVVDAESGEAITADISFPGSTVNTVRSGANGTYSVVVPPGNYRLHAEASGYKWKERTLILKDGDEVVVDFELKKKLPTQITGKVFDSSTRTPVALADITFPGSTVEAVRTNPDGLYSADVTPGNYRIHVEHRDYRPDEKVIAIKEGEKQVIDFELVKIGVPQATLTGKIADADSLTPVMATLSFVGTSIKPVTPEPSTGIYKTTVPPGTYSLKVDAEGYLPQSTPIVLADGETKILNFSLKKIAKPKVGERIVLKGIYFDFNSAVIKPSSYPVLDDAAKVLLAYPKMRVEIGGHTDSVGSDSYNMRLSQMRAESVRNYLITHHGIDPSRLIAVGYGETMPVADNRTRAGRDLNRRIEYKVLSIE